MPAMIASSPVSLTSAMFAQWQIARKKIHRTLRQNPAAKQFSPDHIRALRSRLAVSQSVFHNVEVIDLCVGGRHWNAPARFWLMTHVKR